MDCIICKRTIEFWKPCDQCRENGDDDRICIDCLIGSFEQDDEGNYKNIPKLKKPFYWIKEK